MVHRNSGETGHYNPSYTETRTPGILDRVLFRFATGLLVASLTTGSTVDGAAPASPDDVYIPPAAASTELPRTPAPTPSPRESVSVHPTVDGQTPATPKETSSVPTYTKVNANCHEGRATSMEWQALGVAGPNGQGARIEYVGLNPDRSFASPKDPQHVAIYDGNGDYWPQVGSRQGNVLAGAHRYYEKGKSVFAPNLAEQLATVAMGSVIVFHMEDGGTCSYKVDDTHPLLDKFDKKAGFPAVVVEKNWFRKDGPPGLFIDGCTGKWNAKEGTSQGAGVGIAHLMNDSDA